MLPAWDPALEVPLLIVAHHVIQPWFGYATLHSLNILRVHRQYQVSRLSCASWQQAGHMAAVASADVAWQSLRHDALKILASEVDIVTCKAYLS